MNSGRRNFIKTSLLASLGAAAFPTILPAARPANEKIVIGLIGTDLKGFQNLKYFLNHDNIECGAIYDPDRNILEKRAADIKKIQAGKPEVYNDFRSLLNNKNINVVLNSVSTDCSPLIAACLAGKHIYTKLPLATNNEELNKIKKIQNLKGNVIQTDYWLNSTPELHQALLQLRYGKFGNIKAIRVWNYAANLNSTYPDANTGDNHHLKKSDAELDMHLLCTAFSGINEKEPSSVISTGGSYTFPLKHNKNPDTMMSVFDFGTFNLLWDRSSGIRHKQFNRTKGVAFICTKKTLLIDEQGWQLFASDENSRKAERIENYNFSGKEIELHISNFLTRVRDQQTSGTCLKTAALLSKANQLATTSYLLKKKMVWENGYITL